MAEKSVTWYGDGIYSKPRTDRDGKTCAVYFVRVWVPSEKASRYFKAGRTLRSAETLRRRILADPENAVEKRQKQAEHARGGLTLTQLYKSFTGTYRGRGGTDHYINVLRPMSDAIGKTHVSELTPQTFDRYWKKREALRTSDNRPRVGKSTMRKECIAATMMLKWARQRGLTTVNPLVDYEKPKEPAGAPARALSYEEEDRVLALLPPLERDVVAWALDTAMRRGEILALTWPRIDRAAGVIHVVGTKTNQLRRVPLVLSDRLSDILSRHPQRTTTDLVFRTQEGKPLNRDRLNGMLESAMKSADVPKVRGTLWNVLRKTWVNRFYDSGGLPQRESEITGHSMTVADKHYREHSHQSRAADTGIMNRPATVARTVASKSENV